MRGRKIPIYKNSYNVDAANAAAAASLLYPGAIPFAFIHIKLLFLWSTYSVLIYSLFLFFHKYFTAVVVVIVIVVVLL